MFVSVCVSEHVFCPEYGQNERSLCRAQGSSSRYSFLKTILFVCFCAYVCVMWILNPHACRIKFFFKCQLYHEVILQSTSKLTFENVSSNHGGGGGHFLGEGSSSTVAASAVVGGTSKKRVAKESDKGDLGKKVLKQSKLK